MELYEEMMKKNKKQKKKSQELTEGQGEGDRVRNRGPRGECGALLHEDLVHFIR